MRFVRDVLKNKKWCFVGGRLFDGRGIFNRSFDPLRELFTEIRAIVDTRIDLEPVQTLFAHPIEKRHSIKISKDTGERLLELRHVDFGYPSHSNIINDFSLTLKKEDRLLVTVLMVLVRLRYVI